MKKINKFHLNLCTTALASIGLLVGHYAHAQSTSSDERVSELEVIEVQGVRASLNRALGQKRESVEVTDSISAEDLGKFPDLNISESLQRVPGVTLNRNSNGEGQAINLRGLGPQFTRVEVNGMSGTSNGSGGRFSTSSGGRGFNFELLAAELFSNVTVKKTPTAKQTEGGMAGVVTLETPKPLSYEGTKFTVSAQGNYSEVLEEADPRGSLFFSHNIDNTLGFSASVAYSDTHFQSNTVESGVWRPMNVVGRGDSNDLIANGTRYYIFDEQRDTLGSTFSAQYRPTDSLEMLLSVLYATSDSERLANRNDMPVENPGQTVNYSSENGVVNSASFTGVQQRVGTNYLTTDEEFTQVTFDVKSV
ncbi:MAG: TonB-dependent receptor plug domain-containing protein [Pseudomonadota bacterium]